jgi:hypothetical protein
MNGVKSDLREVRRGVAERLNELNKYLSIELKKATERTNEEIFDSIPKHEARKLCGKVMMQSTVGKSRKSMASPKKHNTTKKVVFTNSARSYNSNNSYYDNIPLTNTVRAMRARNSMRTKKSKTPKVHKKVLKPCKEGMVRNPITNRCKKIENMNKRKKVVFTNSARSYNSNNEYFNKIPLANTVRAMKARDSKRTMKKTKNGSQSKVFSQSRPLNKTKVMNEEAEFNFNAPTRKIDPLPKPKAHEIKQHMNDVQDRVRELQREREARNQPILFNDSNDNNNNNTNYMEKPSDDSEEVPKLFDNDDANNQEEVAKRKRFKELFGESESYDFKPLPKENMDKLFKNSEESSNV